MDLSGYSFEKVGEEGEYFILRGWLEGNPVFLMVPSSDHPSPAGIERMNHIYSLRNELNSAWAARPFDFAEYRGLRVPGVRRSRRDFTGLLDRKTAGY